MPTTVATGAMSLDSQRFFTTSREFYSVKQTCFRVLEAFGPSHCSFPVTTSFPVLVCTVPQKYVKSSKGSRTRVLNEECGASSTEGAMDNASSKLQDQFNRFAAAVALSDRKMAEEVIKEMGDGDNMNLLELSDGESESSELLDDPESTSSFLDEQFYDFKSVAASNDWKNSENVAFQGDSCTLQQEEYGGEMGELEKQLDLLYEEVERMIEEGDFETACELIEANYEVLLEQLNSGVQGVEQVAMLDVLAQLYMNMGDFENATLLLQKIKGLLEFIPHTEPLLNHILAHVGCMYAGLGKPGEALPYYVESLNMQESSLGESNPLTVKTMLGLARTYSELDEGRKSIKLYRKVVKIMEKSSSFGDESLVVPLTHLGHVLLEEERVTEAESVLQRAVMVTERAHGMADGRVGVAMCGLARSKSAQGDVDEAVRLYLEGLKIMEGCSKFSADDPVIENVRTDLAELLNFLDRDEEAQNVWKMNLKAKEDSVGQNDVQLITHLHNLATSYFHSKKFAECEPMLRRMLKLATVHFGTNSPEVSVSLELLAATLHQQGKQFQAEGLARQALYIREKSFGMDDPNTGQACSCLASILLDVGRYGEAEALVERVLRIQEKELGRDSPEIMETLELLVMLLDKQGRKTEARPLMRRLQRIAEILSQSRTSDPEQCNDEVFS